MDNKKRRIISWFLCVVLLFSIIPISKLSAGSKLDSEVKRAITLGLISNDYLKKSNKAATTKDIENIVVKILKKRGASDSKIKKWKKLANGTSKTATSSDSIMAVYYGSVYLSKNGIPKTNSDFSSDRWFPKDWSKAFDCIEKSGFIKVKKGTFKYYNSAEGWHGHLPIVKNDVNFTLATMFAISQVSHYSGQYIFQQSYKDGNLYITKSLTRLDLVLQMVRFYDSFEEKAKFVKIDSLADKAVISYKKISNAKKVPEVDTTGTSNEYVGSYVQNYGEVGADGTLQFTDDLTWNFRETDFKAMADMGINYVRVQFAINSLAYPDYSKDRTKVNETIVRDLDNVVTWGLKYGLHVSICFQGYLDDDIDGLGAIDSDGTKANEFTPDYLATKESYKMKAKLLKAFAGRYKNVPAKYLSFELQNENSTNYSVPNGIVALSVEEMADQFIMLANSIWEISPERGVSLSTDETLSKDNLAYWSKIAQAGINLDYHCYEPRSFVAPDSHRHVDAKNMIWPNFVDQNNQTWNMERVYKTYILPWKNLAENYNVGFKLGECGIFLGDYTFSKSPYKQKYVVAWANDFATVMQKHQVSYVIGKGVGNTGICSIIKDFPPTNDNLGAYIKDAKYIKKKYSVDGYSIIYYINDKIAQAAYSKH